MGILTVLVTGCAGYIGAICSQLLVEAGYKVIGLDNLSKGFAKNVPAALKFYQGCISDSKLVAEIIRQEGVEAVMHFAAYSDVAESVREPELYKENNYMKTLVLLKSLQAAGVNKFIFSSTAAVYGNPNKPEPLFEEGDLQPINPYGYYKLEVEKYLRAVVDQNFKYVTLRYFNVAGAYGELGECHQPETHLIPLAIDAALKKRDKFYLFGNDYETKDGTAIRDYIHVVDLANAHIAALKFFTGDKANLNQAYNLGYGQGFTVREVVETVEKISGLAVNAQPAPRREGDPQMLVADTTKAIKTGLFKPQFNSIDKIVEDAYKHRLKYYGI